MTKTHDELSGEVLRRAWADASIALWEDTCLEETGDHLDLLRTNNAAWAIGVDEDYCGHTHAVSGQNVGNYIFDTVCLNAQIKPQIREKTLISTARLAGMGPEGSSFDVEPETPLPDEITKGDLVVVLGEYPGQHIVMAIGPPDGDGEFETIEGNSRGLRGDGTHGRGVVARTRNVNDVVTVYRLQFSHFVYE